jgi:hypothetical protein
MRCNGMDIYNTVSNLQLLKNVIKVENVSELWWQEGLKKFFEK